MSTKPKILFSMAHAGFYRNFERTIGQLISYGYDVELVFTKKHKAISIDHYPTLEAGEIPVTLPKFPVSKAQKFTYRLRVLRDILFYAKEEFRDADSLRARFVANQKGYITEANFRRLLALFEAMPNFLRVGLDMFLGFLESRMKPNEAATKIVQTKKPDLIVVTPLVHFFTNEIEILKAAHKAGTPTVLAVASWDNLSNKGVMKAKPDLVAVWNETMAGEALNLHGVARKNVTITGATVFDWWYDKGDIWDREIFFEAAKVPHSTNGDDVATLLYLCSSVSIADGSEVELVENWVRAVHQSPDPRIKNARILVRLHPMNRRPWEDKIAELDLQLPEDRLYSIYPTDVTHPTSSEQKASFLNSVFHADAIVGLNTSAMIEAAIMEKPVLTFKGHGSEESQMKNLHFTHLVNSGCVRLSETLPEHVNELAEVLSQPEQIRKSCRDFVHNFVRPRGLENETAKCLADDIDALYKAKSRPGNT